MVFGFYKCQCEDLSHVGYDAVPLAEWFQTFRRNILPSSSRVKRAFAWTVKVLVMKTIHSFEMLGTIQGRIKLFGAPRQ